jgi:hypothetical protein
MVSSLINKNPFTSPPLDLTCYCCGLQFRLCVSVHKTLSLDFSVKSIPLHIMTATTPVPIIIATATHAPTPPMNIAWWPNEFDCDIWADAFKNQEGRISVANFNTEWHSWKTNDQDQHTARWDRHTNICDTAFFYKKLVGRNFFYSKYAYPWHTEHVKIVFHTNDSISDGIMFIQPTWGDDEGEVTSYFIKRTSESSRWGHHDE